MNLRLREQVKNLSESKFSVQKATTGWLFIYLFFPFPFDYHLTKFFAMEISCVKLNSKSKAFHNKYD